MFFFLKRLNPRNMREMHDSPQEFIICAQDEEEAREIAAKRDTPIWQDLQRAYCEPVADNDPRVVMEKW